MYSEIWSLDINPSLRNSGQAQCSALGTTPDLSQCLGRGYRLEIDLHVLMVGEIVGPGGNPHDHKENMQSPHRQALPQPGIKPRTADRSRFLRWDPDISTHNRRFYLSGLSHPLEMVDLCWVRLANNVISHVSIDYEATFKLILRWYYWLILDCGRFIGIGIWFTKYAPVLKQFEAWKKCLDWWSKML